MIDWLNLAGNALWILGSALALATLSYASWEASQRGERLRARLGMPGPQMALDAAGVLFCAGLAVTASAQWETWLWAALGALFLVQMLLLLRKR